jgi:hypothetical protein
MAASSKVIRVNFVKKFQEKILCPPEDDFPVFSSPVEGLLEGVKLTGQRSAERPEKTSGVCLS